MDIFFKFLNGDLKLWKSFWIIGFIHGFSIMYLLPILEVNLFQNNNIFNTLIINDIAIDILDYNKITIFSKLLIIFSSIIITVGIWRSAEKYKGNLSIIFLTLIYLTINNLIPLFSYFKRLFV